MHIIAYTIKKYTSVRVLITAALSLIMAVLVGAGFQTPSTPAFEYDQLKILSRQTALPEVRSGVTPNAQTNSQANPLPNAQAAPASSASSNVNTLARSVRIMAASDRAKNDPTNANGPAVTNNNGANQKTPETSRITNQPSKSQMAGDLTKLVEDTGKKP